MKRAYIRDNRNTKCGSRGRERRDKPITSRPSFPFFLTSLFEELIAASIRLCRRFGSLVFANENYRTHGARCHCLRTIYFSSYTERRISKQRGNTSVNTKACPEREKRVSTWLARALFPMYLWMCRMWHEDVFRSLNSKRKTTRGYTGVLEEVFVRVALSILDFQFGLYRDSWDSFVSAYVKQDPVSCIRNLATNQRSWSIIANHS